MAGRYSLSLTMNIHASVQQKSNARKAQSIIDVEYTWLGAAEIKIQEGTVSVSLTFFTHGLFAVGIQTRKAATVCH